MKLLPRKQFDLGPYCLRYWLPKNIIRREKQKTKVMAVGLRVEKRFGCTCIMLKGAYIIPFTPLKRLWTPLKCEILENIMKNVAFAPEEEMFHFP